MSSLKVRSRRAGFPPVQVTVRVGAGESLSPTAVRVNVAIAAQTRRLEGSSPVLTYIQVAGLGSGS